MSTNSPETVIEVASHGLLADCERRAIELYYAAPPEKLAGDCRRELVEEFGESVVAQMLTNGIGNNGSANDKGLATQPAPRRLTIKLFNHMETPTNTAPPVALDRLVRRCVTHHHACDCREALQRECLVMLAVFRGCMVTRTLPTSDSPCARKVCELLTMLDPTGELAPDNFAAGGGTDAEIRILPRPLPPVAIPPTNV